MNLSTPRQRTSVPPFAPVAPVARRALSAGLAVATFATIATLGACTNNLFGPNDPTTASVFSANVAGAVQLPLSGTAALVRIPAATMSGTSFPASAVLELRDHAGASVGFQWADALPPAAGSYSVGFGAQDLAMSFDQGSGATGTSFDGTAGTVTVTSSSDQQVAGSFSVTAVAQDTRKQVTVTGTFSAKVVTQSASAPAVSGQLSLSGVRMTPIPRAITPAPR